MHDVRWQGQGSTHENSLSLLAQPHASKLLRRLRSHSLRSEAALKVFVGVLPLPIFEAYETFLARNASISCSTMVIPGYCVKLLVSCCVTDIEKGFINGV